MINWIYENTINAKKARERIADLQEISDNHNLDIKLSMLFLKGSYAGVNVNASLSKKFFTDHDSAQKFLRTECIKLKRARREIQKGKQNDEKN